MLTPSGPYCSFLNDSQQLTFIDTSFTVQMPLIYWLIYILTTTQSSTSVTKDQLRKSNSCAITKLVSCRADSQAVSFQSMHLTRAQKFLRDVRQTYRFATLLIGDCKLLNRTVNQDFLFPSCNSIMQIMLASHFLISQYFRHFHIHCFIYPHNDICLYTQMVWFITSCFATETRHNLAIPHILNCWILQ